MSDELRKIEEESVVFDLETPKGCFLASFLPIKGEDFLDFLVNEYQNDIYKLVKYLEENKDRYFIGFNNISFDNQVLEFILDNYEKWFDLSGREIAIIIGRFASDTIENTNYGLFPPYKEERFRVKAIDCPRILHWFNENRRVSLKQAEFELRAETIENFEISPDKEDFTLDEVQDLIFYCHNDVKYTKEIFLHIIGDTQHPFYKGRNKISDRLNFMKEVELKCLNWDDVKIGAEWNKLDYCKATGKDEKDLKPSKVNVFYGKKYKNFFPNTVFFQGQKIRDFINDIGNTPILAQKQEFTYNFNDNLKVTIARGGLHSSEGPRIIRPEKGVWYIQNDIGSQYPKAIIKYKAFPKHLGIPWLDMLVGKVVRRLLHKKKYKETKDPVYNSLQETGKYALNGGAYGRLGTPGDWQEDPCALLKVTLGCQLEILMIVEALILNGFEVVSVNTDGWDCLVPDSKLQEYFGIVEFYEKAIKADPGTIEFTVFEYMVQTSVNDYMAKKIGVFENKVFKEDKIVMKSSPYPDLKLKGDFTVDFELHKNSSFRIIPLALVEYFSSGVNYQEFIEKHSDIFDFCARSNSGSTYFHEGYKGNESFSLPKLIRYYVSKEGIKIKKRVKEGIMTGARDQNVQPKDRSKTVCNRLLKKDQPTHLNKIDRSWYIDKVAETIFKIEKGRPPKKEKQDPNQLNLFQ